MSTMRRRPWGSGTIRMGHDAAPAAVCHVVGDDHGLESPHPWSVGPWFDGEFDRQNVAVDHTFESRAGGFDVSVCGFDTGYEADALGSHDGGRGGEDVQDLMVVGAGYRRPLGGELGGGEGMWCGAGGCQVALDAGEQVFDEVGSLGDFVGRVPGPLLVRGKFVA